MEISIGDNIDAIDESDMDESEVEFVTLDLRSYFALKRLIKMNPMHFELYGYVISYSKMIWGTIYFVAIRFVASLFQYLLE